YDYVVVGGGTSGLTVADRLTEDPKTTVVVVEYGCLRPSTVAIRNQELLHQRSILASYQSIPQPGLDNRSSPVYSAAVVCGGTAINGMFFNRGSAGDYDTWEQLGNPGWGWNGLLPYFKKINLRKISITFTPPPEDLAAQYPIPSDLSPHGTSGPVGSSFSRFQYPVIKNFFSGWNGIGVASNPQPNVGDANGAFYSTLSLDFKNQSRSSASTAYYRPMIGKRPNYHLVAGQSVTKILFSKKTMRATSVNPPDPWSNFTHSVSACHEVIHAAGAVHSPQILQLSGVGPKKLLFGLGVDTLVDLPGVGYNFQDQPSMFMSFN
ncbi:glucose-methanol-choline oxidoreductase, partial [Cryomyces antarcticus]